jgi:hypothetical protein
MQTKSRSIPNAYTPNWLEGLDGRTALAQEMRRRYDAFVSDLGGDSALSYAQRSLVTRALWLELHLQQQEEALANGQDFDSGKWVQAVNSLQGVLKSLGLKRVTKDVKDLSAYLAERSNSR